MLGAAKESRRLSRLRQHFCTVPRGARVGEASAGVEDATRVAARRGQVYFLRHGQSVFNNATQKPPKGWGMQDVVLWDGPLTSLGQLQAKAVREVVNAIPNLGLIVVSPLTRALQTCELACEDWIQARGTRVLVQPLVRERVSGADDLGSSPADLVDRFPAFDFSECAAVWWWSGTFPPAGQPVEGDWAGGGEEDASVGRARYLQTRSEPGAPPRVRRAQPYNGELGGLGFDEPDEIYEPRREACQRWLAETSDSLGEQSMLVVSHYDTIVSLIAGEKPTMSRNCQLTLTEVQKDESLGARLVYRQRWTDHLDSTSLPAETPDGLVPMLVQRGKEEGSSWTRW